MKNNFTVFYSWQSDILETKKIIASCIDKAVKGVVNKKKNQLTLEILAINVDRDTKNVSGSPPISKTVFDKIDLCDIFICDVTIINKSYFNYFFKSRLTPNPNVMIELGYAVNLLGWDRIICINNLNISKAEELPFDLRGHKITNFDSKSKTHKEDLTNTLTTEIKTIIDKYDSILIAKAKTKYQRHDYEIYNNFIKKYPEEILFEGISLAVNSLFTNEHYSDMWDNISRVYSETINKFISEDLNLAMVHFIKELKSFNTMCCGNFHLEKRPNYSPLEIKQWNGEQLTDAELFKYKQSQIYRIHKDPVNTETWEEADKRVLKVQDKLYEQGKKVKSLYSQFIMEVKRKIISQM